MSWFKPNVSALLTKGDYQELGKLLRHKEDNIRRASAEALLALLQKECKRGPSSVPDQIRSQFRGLNDNDVIAVLMDAIEKLPMDVGTPYGRYLILTALSAGGARELIAFNKRIAPVLSDTQVRQGGWPNNELSSSISYALFEHAVARRFGIKELVDIIPYAVVNGDIGLDVSRLLEQSGVLTLPKEDITAIRERIAHLPPRAGGLKNCVTGYLGKEFLSKLKAAEDPKKEE
jgi:hypothetical protein